MNAIFASGLTILAAAAAFAAPTASLADEACDPKVIQSKTLFPIRSQLRHQTGTVYLNVTVDQHGRAQSAELVRSSGYRLLDRAATRSVISNWVFDTSDCERKDLPIGDLVAVEYRNEAY